MKKAIFATTAMTILLLLSVPAFAQNDSSECVNLRFEAQDFFCTLEAKRSEDAAGTSSAGEALKEKIRCQNSFLKTCNNEIASGISDGICELIKFELKI